MARFAGTQLADYFSTPNFTAMGSTSMKGQSMQRNAATKAEGLVHGAGINSMAQVASAGFQADAIKAQGQAAGQSAMWQGISSGISGLAGGFGAMGGGGGGAADTFGAVGSKGSDMASFGYTPAQDVAFNSGVGIDYGYL